MAPHASTLAWKLPWMEEPGGLQSMGLRRVGHNWVTSISLSLSCIGEGNGNPLQCSCLENPRGGEPGGLPSMGSHGVGHDWSDLAAAAAAAESGKPGLRKWQCCVRAQVWGASDPHWNTGCLLHYGEGTFAEGICWVCLSSTYSFYNNRTPFSLGKPFHSSLGMRGFTVGSYLHPS